MIIMKALILTLCLLNVTSVFSHEVDLKFCNPESASKVELKILGTNYQFIKTNAEGNVIISKKGKTTIEELDEEDQSGNGDVVMILGHIEVNIIKGTQFNLDIPMAVGDNTTLMILVDDQKNSHLLHYEFGGEEGQKSFYLGSTTACLK
jgi:hypothetical protein